MGRDILAIVGPTASGKTALALALARRLGAEVISADMGQLYRRLDAGTAKPAGRWSDGVYKVDGVPVHCVDILDPSEPTDAGSYARAAQPVLDRIRSSGRPAIVAGGTGLYVRALLDGLDELPGRDPGLRAALAARAEREGRPALHAELARRDPEAARRIPPGNLQRVVRALEVLELTGRPISASWTRRPAGAAPSPAVLGATSEGPKGPPSANADVKYFALRRSPEELAGRIRERAREMFPLMVRETAALVPAFYTGEEPGFRCLGYPEALAAARGGLAEEEGLARMTRATLAYARRQGTWFRNQTPARWLEPEAAEETIAREIPG